MMQLKSILLRLAGVLLLSAATLGLSAQSVNTNPVELPSTTVWQFEKHNNVQPNLYTGTLSLSVPIYTYKDSDFELPISISYSSNGLRPNVLAGVVGHDWSLNVGGVVTRQVRGLADEKRLPAASPFPIYGFLETHRSLGQQDANGNYNDGLRPGDEPEELWAVNIFNANNTSADDLNMGADNPTFYYAPNNYILNDYLYYQGPLYDMEPDEFSFNFLGYSGKFELGFSKKIYVYDTNTRDTEFTIELPGTNLSEIVITTGDGYRYTFGTGLAREHGGDNEIGTAWKLSRITAPNGREVVFTYSRSPQTTQGTTLSYSSYNQYGPSGLSYSYQGEYYPLVNGIYDYENLVSKSIDYRPILPQLSLPNYVSALTDITISDGAKVNFFYKTLSQSESGASTTLNNLPKLDQIIVSYGLGATTLKTCSLEYTFPQASASNKIPFLSSITISGLGTYSMNYDYTSSTVFPKHGSFATDHWGYYNGYSGTASSFYARTEQNAYLEESVTSSVRDASFNHAKLGMLKSVTYPTGGKTTFEYEAHTYSSHGVREYPDFDITYRNNEGGIDKTAGGVRIKSIKDYIKESDTTPAYVRTFTYGSSASSGTLAPLPRYGLHYTKTQNVGSSPSISSYLGSYINLYPVDGSHIDYSEVTENLPEGSITYYFSNVHDCPDGKLGDTRNYMHNRYYDVSYLTSLTGDDVREAIMQVMTPPISMQDKRGRIIKTVTKNAAGTTLSESINTYDNYTYAYETLDKVWRNQSLYIGSALGATVIEDVPLLSVTERVSGVNTTKSYTYNDSEQITSTRINDSRGMERSIHQSYLADLDDSSLSAVHLSMKRKNITNNPLYEEERRGTQTLTRWTYSYIQPAASQHPDLYRVGTVSETDVLTGESSTITYRYDNEGRLLQKTDGLGRSTVYIWGYGGLYPVAVIANCTLAQVSAISGLSAISSSPLSADASQYASALRAISGAEVTLYQYMPLIGLTKEITPDGKEISYSYNAAGKLHQVLDDLGRNQSTTLYSTENKSSSL